MLLHHRNRNTLLILRSIINLIRLFFLLIIFGALYFFLRKRAIYLFLKSAGPSFIKLGQALATRPDLVGHEMSETLSHFQDRLDPFSQKKVRKILRKEYGENLNTKFLEFDYTAKASASIAQVHKAKIVEGEYVAVKILRPHIRSIVTRDIATLALIAKLMRLFSKNFAKALRDINAVLKEAAKSELNLLKEGANAMRLKDELHGLQGFYVPRIFLKYSSQNILVSQWIDGIPFSDKKTIQSSNFDKKQIAQNLVVSYFTQVYSHGFFHADMHPGNLFLMRNGDIAVVDFGIMGEIDKKTRLAVAEILIAFLHKDYKRVAKLHIEAGLVPRHTSVYDLALHCEKIGESIVGVSVKDISLATLLSSLIDMTHEYKMATKPELLLLQKTLLLVEGVGVMLDENLNMWELARPWVKEWAKKNIGFDAKIRDAIVDLFEAVKDAVKGRDI